MHAPQEFDQSRAELKLGRLELMRELEAERAKTRRFTKENQRLTEVVQYKTVALERVIVSGTPFPYPLTV